MSNLTKLFLGVAFVSLLVAGYQAHEATGLRAENQLLDQEALGRIVPARPSPKDAGRRRRESGELSEEKPGHTVDEALRRQIEMADHGTHEYHVDYVLMEKGGQGLSPKAAKAAGLTPEEERHVDEILKRIWNDATEDFARRAELVEAESEEKTGRRVYLIPARPDRGWEFKNQLLDELADAVGASKRAILMRGYQCDEFLAGFGAQDVRIEFTAGEKKFTFAYLNPLDGEATLFGSVALDRFNDQFGNSFEIPAAAKSEEEPEND